MTFYQVAFLFFTYSFLGWVGEVVFTAAVRRKYQDRGVLSGPLCILYGISALVITFALRDIRDGWFFLFVFSAVYATVIEWIGGHILEYTSHTRWWDYSTQPFNLDGYICLGASVTWGVLGVIMLKWGNPLLLALYSLVPRGIWVVVLLAALVVIPYGQTSIMWFAPAALLAIGILLRIGNWYKRQLTAATAAPVTATAAAAELPRRKIRRALLILTVLVFSKYFYIACMTNYFTFFLMDKFAFSVQDAQYSLFAFLAASAAGTVIGGPLGDRIGRKYVIWGSILGAAPFALMLPYAGSGGAVVLAILVGLIISSAFSAIVVYATDLMPGRVGMIAGLFFGLMFGLGGLGSAFFGWLADRTSIEFIFRVSALLPLMGIITGFLPDVERKR